MNDRLKIATALLAGLCTEPISGTDMKRALAVATSLIKLEKELQEIEYKKDLVYATDCFTCAEGVDAEEADAINIAIAFNSHLTAQELEFRIFKERKIKIKII